MMAERKHSKKKSHPRTQDITPIMNDLLEAVKDVRDVIDALDRIPGFKISPQERVSIGRLRGFARKHALIVKEGGKPDHIALSRTVGLAKRVWQDLDNHFAKFMGGAPEHFDNIVAEIRKDSKEVLERSASELSDLEGKFNQVLGSEKSSYEDIINAYKAVVAFLESLSREAVAAADAAREVKRQERRAGIADETLRALDELKI